MGLAVGVGTLADLIIHDEEGADHLREALAQVNAVLEDNGLPPHIEPEELPRLESRASIGSYPYSFLHHLRRFAAHASTRPQWKPKPFPDSENPAHDPVVIDELAMLSSHLLCHSDCDGYYVPIDLPEPLFDDAERIPGGMLGSSQRLMKELVAVAPLLGIKLTHSELSEREADSINQRVEAEGDFWIELAVWISLFESARLSIEHKTVIRFG